VSIRKDAMVYLPYGYEKESRNYPVLYLMHGGGGNAQELFGVTIPGDDSGTSYLQRLLDNLISGEIVSPMIVVTPTFMIPGKEAARRSVEVATQLTHRFPAELDNDLIPAIDAAFRTRRDRWSRAFGGFSMGAETTWSVLSDCLQDVAVYLPLSGDYWAIGLKGGKDFPEETADALITKMAASGVAPGDYRVFACTGDRDIAYEAMEPFVMALSRRVPWFTSGEKRGQGCLQWLLKPEGWHTYHDCMEYLYAAAPFLFPTE